MEVRGHIVALAALHPGKEPPVPILIGGWVNLRACLDVVAKRKFPCPCRESNPGRPSCSLVSKLSKLSGLFLDFSTSWNFQKEVTWHLK